MSMAASFTAHGGWEGKGTYGKSHTMRVALKEMYIDTFNRVPFSIPIALVGRAVAGLGCSG